jgi:hypothetical protein
MTPRVKDIIRIYKEGNIQKVDEYLNQPGMIVDPNSWEGRIKKLIDDKLYNTAKCELELVGYKLLKNI